MDGPAKYSMWANYLDVFDEVGVLARVGSETKECAEEARADGPGVEFWALPDYHGPWGYVHKLPKLKKCVREAVEQSDAYILRVPGLVGGLVWRELKSRGKCFALEVVGDPWDALGPGTWPSVFRPAFRRVATFELKAMCREASAVHYVTQASLQRRYPAGRNAYVTGFSDALMDSAFATAERMEERFQRIDEIAAERQKIHHTGHRGTTESVAKSREWRVARGAERQKTYHRVDGEKAFRIGFIGSFSQMYKGPDVLLRAVAACRAQGLNVEASLAGEGRCAAAMKALAEELGIGGEVEFLGQLPAGEAVFAFLDSIDLFVMPSFAEGLPRALLEAMARGCPCVGSAVGGIPELLEAAETVPAGEPSALAEKVMEVAGDAGRMKQMASRNLEKSREFSPELLTEVRREFCRAVRAQAEGAPGVRGA